MTLNLLAITAALWSVMGKVSLAARRAQIGILLQTVGWVLLMASGLVAPGSGLDRALSTLAIGGIGAGVAYNAAAFDRWCGRETVARAPTVVAIAMVAGYGIGFNDYAFRVGWANGLLTLQVGLVLVALCRNTDVPVGRWRWLLVASLVVQMAVTAARGVLGAFYSELFPNFFTPHPANVLFALATNVTAVMSMVAILLAHRDEAERELERLACIDGVTGALNRRAWMERAAVLVADSRRLRQPLCALLVDLDHFKDINDTYGHEAGDRALKLFVDGMHLVCAKDNLICRYGGEEFSMLKRGAGLDAMRAYDQRLRAWLAETAPRELGMALTYSAGITVLLDEHDTVDAMLRRADALLYSAKMLGRNRTLDEQMLESQLQ
ncbi:diguanylate cyclase [Duganella sp. FT50W]|uniref:diguanylate cyclase n=1 Tax=Duganella lactea TaxID=2692173 RepID=A0A6L8ME41_9BURK|nr:GGDEF domain-containing protein [Duganella lactea]MYM80704.1 diguanylate cyclase [Duganella lactea]